MSAETLDSLAADPWLQIDHLQVSFGPGRDAVTGLSLTARRGEVVAVVGESGCGKTVSMLALAGLLPRGASASGSARLGDTELVGASERAMRRLRGVRIGTIFQDASTALNPLMSIGAQIEEVLLLHTRAKRTERRRRVIELLDAVGVPDPASRLRSMPHQLSGGLRQRVMIAVALAGDPDLVVADEPTTALDVTVQAQVLAVLRERTREAVLLFVTHDMGVVAEIADSVVVMYAGEVVETGPVREILDAPQHPYTAALLASVPDPDAPVVGALPTIPGRVPALGSRDAGCPFRERCPKADDKCTEMPPLTGDRHRAACWHPVGRDAQLEGVS